MATRTLARRVEVPLARAGAILGFWIADDVDAVMHAVAAGRHCDRDVLLIGAMFIGGPKISETLSVRLSNIRPGSYPFAPMFWTTARPLSTLGG